MGSAITAWKVSKYGVYSGPYFPVFSPNAGKYEPEKTPYLDTFHTVYSMLGIFEIIMLRKMDVMRCFFLLILFWNL